MTSITRFALAHRRVVALLWIMAAPAGAFATPAATSRLTHSFATPGNASGLTLLAVIALTAVAFGSLLPCP
jgi:hypothetical protein